MLYIVIVKLIFLKIKKMGRHTDIVFRKYFEEIDDKNSKCTINNCAKVLSNKLSNLKRHLQTTHKILFDNILIKE